MPTVIAHNRRELEAGENFLFPRAVKHPGDDDFVALIELGEASIEIDVGGILGAIVAVEIGGGIESLAEGVIGKQGEVSAETFLYFENAALIEGIGLGGVLVILHDKRVHETANAWIIAGQTARFGPSQWVGSRRGRIPIAIGNRLAIRE